MLILAGCDNSGELRSVNRQGGAKKERELTPMLKSEELKNIEALSDADNIRNPFLTVQEQEMFSGKEKRLILDYLRLTGVMYSKGKKIAIIDGRIVREGDTIDDKSVRNIFSDYVILADKKGEYVVQLYN